MTMNAPVTSPFLCLDKTTTFRINDSGNKQLIIQSKHSDPHDVAEDYCKQHSISVIDADFRDKVLICFYLKMGIRETIFIRQM
jgi:hypothetical protein